MKKNLLYFICMIVVQSTIAQTKTFTITKQQLLDKIKGGWAGQTIGVTFGGPYEFQFSGSFINENQPLIWNETLLKKAMLGDPGLFDDLYMDLTFVAVFEKFGLDAPIDSFSNAYAKAGYMLWHANQTARYNILSGMKAPATGNWLNNPHADCIDYQIESDYAGLMSPGLPNTASAISDKIGHIMNYGDGWYGGVYIGAMYSLAFTSNDIHYIVTEGLKTIPKESRFYKTIYDVIQWHKKYPTDWKQTWFEVQKKWTNDVGCPKGVFNPFNIDASVNAAYVVMGLLYGNGDYTKSLQISTRCGQDADCNPSSVAGILGTVLGYNKIPAYWKMGLKEIEDTDFKFTTMSLNETYNVSFSHALKNIQKNGGSIKGDLVTIPVQTPMPVKYEKSFEGHYPLAKIPAKWSPNRDEISFDFEGIGFVLRNDPVPQLFPDYIFHTELYIDNKLVEKPELPASFTTRRNELAWKYNLPMGKHSVKLRILNPSQEYKIKDTEAVIYTNKPVNGWE